MYQVYYSVFRWEAFKTDCGGVVRNQRDLYLIFGRGNFQAFRSFIAVIEWREILNGKSVVDQWQAFSQLLLDACDKFIPRQKRRTIKRSLWLSGTVKKR